MKKLETFLIGLLIVIMFFVADRFNLDLNVVLTVILVITTIIYTRITGEILSSENGPKLYCHSEFVNSVNYDRGIMKDFSPGGDVPEGVGFATTGSNRELKFYVYNNGNRPATKIKVVYSIKVFKNEVTLAEDGFNIEDVSLIEYKTVTKELIYDYIPPNSSIEETVFYLSTYPKCELSIQRLQCKEDKFITRKTVIQSYKDERYDMIGDSQDARNLLGL